MIEAEQQMLKESVERIGRIEKQAHTMLARIDKAARLNAALERSETEMPVPEAPAEVNTALELPFDLLPKAQPRAALNWLGVVSALDGSAPAPSIRAAVERVKEDSTVARLLALFGEVTAELAEERVYPEDLKPEHAPAAIWMRYGKGERGGDITSLAGVSDEITTALVRSRLRGSPEFLALSIRYVGAYAALVERAAEEIGADHRLIELAETAPGRCFMLLAGLLSAFEPQAATQTDAA